MRALLRVGLRTSACVCCGSLSCHAPCPVGSVERGYDPEPLTNVVGLFDTVPCSRSLLKGAAVGHVTILKSLRNQGEFLQMRLTNE